VLTKNNDRAPGGCDTATGVVVDKGVLYGTAQRGGGSQICGQGYGVVFRVGK